MTEQILVIGSDNQKCFFILDGIRCNTTHEVIVLDLKQKAENEKTFVFKYCLDHFKKRYPTQAEDFGSFMRITFCICGHTGDSHFENRCLNCDCKQFTHHKIGD